MVFNGSMAGCYPVRYRFKSGSVSQASLYDPYTRDRVTRAIDNSGCDSRTGPVFIAVSSNGRTVGFDPANGSSILSTRTTSEIRLKVGH